MSQFYSVRAFRRFRELLRDSPAEVVLGAAIGLMVGWGIGYKHESYREHMIPLGFSEITQIEKDAKAAGQEVSPTVRYLTSVNDAPMKVFECWNYSYKAFTLDHTRAFARELDKRMEPTLKVHHYEIPDLLHALPGEAQVVLDKLKDFADVRNRLSIANGALSRAWSASHVDHYHTEIHTYTDSNGTPHVDTEQVYDNTTHTYTYDSRAGVEASLTLNLARKLHPSLVFKDQFRLTSRTNPEGEYAADTSRQLEKGKQRLSSEELRRIANTWYTGSTLLRDMQILSSSWSGLEVKAVKWDQEKDTAESTSYITCSRVDSGPKEYQTAQRALGHGRSLQHTLDEALEGITIVRDTASVLETTINNFVALELGGEKPPIRQDPKKLSREILSMVQDWYTKNFKGGFEVERFRWPMVALAGLIGLISGGLLGLGLDYAGNRFNLWGKPEPRYDAWRSRRY